MKNIRFVSIFFVTMLMLMTVCGCRKKENGSDNPEAQKLYGSWAYNHEPEKEFAVFNEDGTAEYEGKKYTFECDSDFITLKSKKNDDLKIRYKVNEDGIFLYSNTTYTFSGEGKQDGLIGEWSCSEKNWSYIFNEAGRFLEDDCFTGSYTVDKDNSTFALEYEGGFKTTTCYFQLDGNALQIEYPWQMVKTESKK